MSTPTTSVRQLIAQLSPSQSPGTAVASLSSTTCFINPAPGNGYYYIYEIEVLGLQPSVDNSYLGVQFYDTNQNLITEASAYCTEGFSNDSGGNHAFTTNASCIPIQDISRLGISPSQFVFASLRLYDPANPATNKCMNIHCFNPQAVNNQGCLTLASAACNYNTNAIGGVSFSFYSSQLQQVQGNITAGTINIYGILDTIPGN